MTARDAAIARHSGGRDEGRSEARNVKRRPSGLVHREVQAAIAIPAILGAALLVLPIIALIARIDWATLPTVLAQQETRSALALSLGTASIATFFCLIFGVPLAVVISRSHGFLSGLLRGLVTLPLVLPPLIGGLALLTLLGRGGVLGDFLLSIGFRLPFTTAAVIIAQTFVALPFLVISLEGALRGLDPVFAESAATMGAGATKTLFHVTLPMIAPSLLAGIILSFTRALGEFGATALFAGNQADVTRTVPLAIYTAFNGAGVTQDTALTLSFVLIVVSTIALVVLRPKHVDPLASN